MILNFSLWENDILGRQVQEGEGQDDCGNHHIDEKIRGQTPEKVPDVSLNTHQHNLQSAALLGAAAMLAAIPLMFSQKPKPVSGLCLENIVNSMGGNLTEDIKGDIKLNGYIPLDDNSIKNLSSYAEDIKNDFNYTSNYVSLSEAHFDVPQKGPDYIIKPNLSIKGSGLKPELYSSIKEYDLKIIGYTSELNESTSKKYIF